jgi:CelD/BcsL family acetyltransferase involved in cellulose biosynthesis
MLQLLNTPLLKDSKPACPDQIIDGLWIDVTNSLGGLKGDWEDLQNSGLCTFFQSYGWCKSWLETLGRHPKISPVIVVGRNLSGSAAFIFPFQIRQVGPFHVLEWLAQQNSSYGSGLYSRKFGDPVWFSLHFSKLLNMLPRFDVVNLQNCPVDIKGQANPLLSIVRFKAPNTSYSLDLSGDFAALHASKRSAKSIGKIRRRDERLKVSGALEISHDHSSAELLELLRELYTFKDRQLAELGIGKLFGLDQTEFYDLLGQTGHIKLFRLSINGETVCLVLGAIQGDTFHLMVTALSPTAPLPLSPGDMLLRRVIEWCCKAGLLTFDFSPGDSDYKLLWADHHTPLFHHFAARTFSGIPLALFLLVSQTAKRMIKSKPIIWHTFCQLRQILRSR